MLDFYHFTVGPLTLTVFIQLATCFSTLSKFPGVKTKRVLAPCRIDCKAREYVLLTAEYTYILH